MFREIVIFAAIVGTLIIQVAVYSIQFAKSRQLPQKYSIIYETIITESSNRRNIHR